MEENRIEKLINDNMSLVHTMISQIARKKKYCDYEDLFAQARLGLVLAANEFDPSKGVKFSTFAAKFVKREIINFKDAHSHYINGDVEQKDISTAEEPDDRLQIILDEIDKLSIADKNVLMLYFSNASDLSSILNKIISEKRVARIVEQLKAELVI